jgi:hypothetical protein
MKVSRFAVTSVLIGATALWGTTVVMAVEAIRRFESTPGLAADAASFWPADAGVARAHDGSTLVMLVHPHCSCSRASVKELEKILERAPRSMRAYVLVYRPRDFPAGWEQTEVYRAATALRRTEVIIDLDGREAKRFGGFTSGQTFLYDATGRLRFSGGITSLRGHEGANRGRADVIRLASSPVGTGTHPVFGCAITSKTEGGSR